MGESELQSLVVKILGDSSVYKKMIQDAIADTKKFEAEQKAQTEQEKKLKGEINKLTQQSKQILVEAKQREMEAVRQANETFQRGREITESVKTATEKYERTVSELNSLLQQGAISQETYNRAVRRANIDLRAAGNSMTAFGTKLQSFGRSWSLYVSAPLLAIGAVATRSFGGFDQALIESQAIMKLSGDQADRMRKLALDLSTGGKAVQTAEELARSYFYLASAGKTAEQSMSLLPAVARFATAGAFDMAKATDLLTDAQSALGLSLRVADDDIKGIAQDTMNLVRVSDVLVTANQIANANVEQFSEALTNDAGAALKVFHKDVEEGVAVLAALADQGIKGQVAGSDFARFMRLMGKAALDSADAHKKLGFAVYDETGKMRNLASIVKNLEDVTAGLSDEQRAATLEALGFEARIQQVILPLLGTSRAIAQYEARLRSAKGTTEEMAEFQLKAFNNQWQIAKNRITEVMISIGHDLTPTLKTTVEVFQGLLNVWEMVPQSAREIGIGIAALGIAVGPASFAIGTMVRGWGQLISIGPNLVQTILSIKTGIIAASNAMNAFKLGVAAAGFVIAYELYRWNKQVRELNEALEKSLILDGKIEELNRRRQQATLAKAEGMSGPEQVKFLQEQQRLAERNLEFASQSRLARAQEVFNQLDTFGNRSGIARTTNEYRLAKKEVKDAEAQVENLRDFLQEVRMKLSTATVGAFEQEQQPHPEQMPRSLPQQIFAQQPTVRRGPALQFRPNGLLGESKNTERLVHNSDQMLQLQQEMTRYARNDQNKERDGRQITIKQAALSR